MSEQIVAASSRPLFVFTFFSFPVALRALLSGWLMAHRETGRLAPSAVARVSAVLITILFFSALGRGGAPMGVAALLAGFVVESVTVAWIAGRFRRELKTSAATKELDDRPDPEAH